MYIQSSMEDRVCQIPITSENRSNGINALLREKMHAQPPSHTPHNWQAGLLQAAKDLKSEACFQSFTFIPTARQCEQF